MSVWQRRTDRSATDAIVPENSGEPEFVAQPPGLNYIRSTFCAIKLGLYAMDFVTSPAMRINTFFLNVLRFEWHVRRQVSPPAFLFLQIWTISRTPCITDSFKRSEIRPGGSGEPCTTEHLQNSIETRCQSIPAQAATEAISIQGGHGTFRAKLCRWQSIGESIVERPGLPLGFSETYFH